MLGRPVLKIQRTGANDYQTTVAYNSSGRISSLVYPSSHSLTYNYDAAGRLGDRDPQTPAMSGNLGDGVARTYSSAITYSQRNTLAQEKLGTDIPIYNKLFYNSRGQLSEIRESTSPNNTTWNRGAIINHYSNQCWGRCAGHTMTDNNGSMKRQEHWVPENDQSYPNQTFTQQYAYDDLNRLQSVSESHYLNEGSLTQSWTQAFNYDRYGNRSINQAGTTQGVGINSSLAAVVQNTATNRIYAPGEIETNHPLINYDQAGNQTRDYYSGNGVRYDRVFDAESRITASLASDTTGSQASAYAYDGNGARVRRNANNQETWMIYGIGGELLAEYQGNSAAATPQREYGYRNGQLLVTASMDSSTGTTPTGPVGYWKFDENSGATVADASGNAHPGTLQAGAQWNSGKSGAAVELDGVNDYVQVGAHSSLAMTNNVSLSAWIYPTGSGSHSVYGGTIMGKEGEYLVNRAANGNIQWAFANGNPGWSWVNTGGVAPLNQWTHLAVVYDTAQIKTYVNGSLIHSYSGAGPIGDYDGGAHNDFRIGGRQDSVQHFQGRIDEVRIYNRSLSSSEIGTLAGVQQSGLVGAWGFDENTGTAATDSSGNGRTGTLTSGASWATGQSGAAVNLDGVNDYVQVGPQSGLVMTNSASFCAWIYPTGSGSHSVYGGVILGKEGEYLVSRARAATFSGLSQHKSGWAWINTGAMAPLNQWTRGGGLRHRPGEDLCQRVLWSIPIPVRAQLVIMMVEPSTTFASEVGRTRLNSFRVVSMKSESLTGH